MRLINCHIENFGRLHDLTVEFEPDFQLISEPNGWGKSTLAAFICVMFFGFEGGNGCEGKENERKRFEPWQGGAYGGQITFETGGRTYTAARIFGDEKANDSFYLRDARTNLKCDNFTENLGEEIFRINGESFARTVLTGQNASLEDAIRDCGKRELMTGEDLFPNEVPTEEELQACLTACNEMNQAVEGMRNYALSDREQAQLRELDYEVRKETEGTPKKEVPSDVREDEASDPDRDMPERLDGKRERKQEAEGEEPPQEIRFPRAWLAFMICGIIVVVIGLVIYVGFVASLPWLLAALAGVALIAVGRYLRSRSGKKVLAESAAMGQLRQDLTVERAARREAEVMEEDARREAESRERDRINALTRERMARRNTLAEKQQKYLSYREQYEEKRTFLLDEIRRMDPLLSSFSEYYDIVTGESGRERTDGSEHIDASQYRLDANTKLTVEEYGMQRENEFLSRGCQDMIGLCLRLALADAIYTGEKPFLILDDPFANPDESSREGGKRLIEAVTQRYQVIYFTCREG